jgi:hypothetical protein
MNEEEENVFIFNHLLQFSVIHQNFHALKFFIEQILIDPLTLDLMG